MAAKRQLSWTAIELRCRAIAASLRGNPFMGVYGVPRGGCVPAAIIATRLGVPLVGEPGHGHVLVVDDLIDSGSTWARYRSNPFVALYRKRWSPEMVLAEDVGDAWLVFPWEVDETPGLDAVLRLAQLAGVDTAGREEAARAALPRLAEMAVSLLG